MGKMFVEVSLPTKITNFYPTKITRYTVFSWGEQSESLYLYIMIHEYQRCNFVCMYVCKLRIKLVLFSKPDNKILYQTFIGNYHRDIVTVTMHGHLLATA